MWGRMIMGSNSVVGPVTCTANIFMFLFLFFYILVFVFYFTRRAGGNIKLFYVATCTSKMSGSSPQKGM